MGKLLLKIRNKLEKNIFSYYFLYIDMSATNTKIYAMS